jgi:hypothetical protein
MIHTSRRSLWLAFACGLTFIACSHYDDLQRNGRESTATASSHNPGRDCMQCHHDSKNSASWERWWNIAGTVSGPGGQPVSSRGTVEIWTGPHGTGTRLYSLPVDHTGNFYSEKISTFRDGYYPIVIADGDTLAMQGMVGGDNVYKSCNSCHGNNGNGLNTPPITLK